MFKLQLISELKEAFVKIEDKKPVIPKTVKSPVTIPPSHKKMALYDKKCIGCGACANVCPATTISISENKKYRIITMNLANCLYCGLCVEACPEKAITLLAEHELPSLNKENLHNELRLKFNKCEHCREIIGTKKAIIKTVKDLFSKGGGTIRELEWVELCPSCRRKFQSYLLITQHLNNV